jgi:hypothetical protein
LGYLILGQTGRYNQHTTDHTGWLFSVPDKNAIIGLMDAQSNRPAWLRILAIFAHPDDEVFCIDVSAFVEQKVAALSAYRTQFPLEPGMFPMPMLREVFSHEYFVRAYPPLEMESSLISMSDVLSLRTG